MARIKIQDLPVNFKLSKNELKKALGGRWKYSGVRSSNKRGTAGSGSSLATREDPGNGGILALREDPSNGGIVVWR